VREIDFGDHLDDRNAMPEINLWIPLVIDNAVPEFDVGDHLDVLGIWAIFKQTENSMTEIDFGYF